MEGTAPEIKNKFAVTDLMNIFSSSTESADGEMLKIASQYALQMTPDQLNTVMRLKMFVLDYGEYNPNIAPAVEMFIKEYLDLKHYHESGMFIRGVIGDLSLKRIIPQDATKINVMKGQ